jgi:hypothetical protein
MLTALRQKASGEAQQAIDMSHGHSIARCALKSILPIRCTRSPEEEIIDEEWLD